MTGVAGVLEVEALRPSGQSPWEAVHYVLGRGGYGGAPDPTGNVELDDTLS